MAKKSKTYGRGIIRPTAHGTYRAEVNHDYRRVRKTFKTELEARSWIDATTVDILNTELPLDAFDVREARRAKMLLPQNVSLVDAAKIYLSHYQGCTPCPLPEAIKQFLAEKAASGRRGRTIAQYRQHLQRLENSFPDANVHEIGQGLLEWINQQGVVGHTRSHLRATLHTFFAWAVKIGYADKNHAEAIATSRVDETLPQFLTVKQCTALLKAAAKTDPALVPMIAVGLFSGIRTAELLRLKSKAIGSEHIHVGPQVAKLRHQRFVTIRENLADWLCAFPPNDGLLCPVREAAMRRRMRKIHIAAKLHPWPHNARRHTFATYHLALFQNAPRTAHEMGHADVEMLYRHYRNLATQKDAQKFFEIRPTFVQKIKPVVISPSRARSSVG